MPDARHLCTVWHQGGSATRVHHLIVLPSSTTHHVRKFNSKHLMRQRDIDSLNHPLIYPPACSFCSSALCMIFCHLANQISPQHFLRSFLWAVPLPFCCQFCSGSAPGSLHSLRGSQMTAMELKLTERNPQSQLVSRHLFL